MLLLLARCPVLLVVIRVAVVPAVAGLVVGLTRVLRARRRLLAAVRVAGRLIRLTAYRVVELVVAVRRHADISSTFTSTLRPFAATWGGGDGGGICVALAVMERHSSTVRRPSL